MFKYFIGAVVTVSAIFIAETVVTEWKADKRAKRNAMTIEANARAHAIRNGFLKK